MNTHHMQQGLKGSIAGVVAADGTLRVTQTLTATSVAVEPVAAAPVTAEPAAPTP